MAAHKLDQLFKKKLNKHLTEPSDGAWTKMEAMLDKSERKPVWIYYKIAAVVTLLIVAGWVTYTFQFDEIQKDRLTEVIDEIPKETAQRNQLLSDNPSKVETEKIEKKDLKIEQKNNLKKVSQLPRKQVVTDTPKVVIDEISSKEEDIPAIIEMAHIDEEMLAINETSGYSPKKVEPIDEPEKINTEKKRRPIRIIYKKGKKKTQPQTMLAENDTTNRKKFNFNSIIDATKNIASGDLLADIRYAKDNFFSQGLDFKKSERFKNENSNK